MIRFSPDILGVTPYAPGTPLEEVARELGLRDVIKLASNENPLGPSPKAIDALRQALTGVHRYPDGRGVTLRERVAERLNVTPEEVILGNGSNEIIELLVRGFLVEGDEAVMATPTFSLYKLMVAVAHGRAVQIPLHNSRPTASATRRSSSIMS